MVLFPSFTHDDDLPTTDFEGGFACMLGLQSKWLPALRHFPSVRAGEVRLTMSASLRMTMGVGVALLLPWDVAAFKLSRVR